MIIKDLREGLSSLKKTLKSWQTSKRSTNDLEQLENLLANFDDLSVAQFCNQVEKALLGQSTSRPKAGAKLNLEIIKLYSTELNNLGEDRVRFLSFFADLKADKRARLGELRQIANSYIGNKRSYRKKSEAYEDIELTFEAKISTSQRLSRTSDIF